MAASGRFSMTTLEFFNGFIDPACHKISHDLTEYGNIKMRADVKLIKATTFYQIYKHNVFGSDGHRLTMKEFFHICGQYLYYDKYICEHGTEFYYLVVFNKGNETYTLTADLIDQRIEANAPATLTDLVRVFEAISRKDN